MAPRVKDNKAKERKQKIFLAVGGVLLLAILAFELPKIMKGSPAPPAAVTTTATVTAADGSTAAPVAPTPVAGTTGSSTMAFAAAVDKVQSVSTFGSRDPFDSHGAGAAIPPPTATKAPAPSFKGSTASAKTTSGPLFGTVEGTAAIPKGGSSLPAASIVLNGHKMKVKLGDSFPSSKPYFRLAGVGAGSLTLSVVKGGLASGSSTLKLKKHKPVTLVNTIDGGRFTIEYLSPAKGG
jgi:hypothetical protein